MAVGGRTRLLVVPSTAAADHPMPPALSCLMHASTSLAERVRAQLLHYLCLERNYLTMQPFVASRDEAALALSKHLFELACLAVVVRQILAEFGSSEAHNSRLAEVPSNL